MKYGSYDMSNPKYDFIGFKIKPTEKRRLFRHAKRNNRTASDVIRQAIREYMIKEKSPVVAGD